MFSLSEQTRSGKTNLAENIRKHIDHIGDLVLDRFCARVTRKILEKGLGKTKLSTKWQWVCFGSWPSQNKAYANISSLDQFLLKMILPDHFALKWSWPDQLAVKWSWPDQFSVK